MQPIRPLLEAIAPSSLVLPWGVAEIASCGLILAWDNRPESARSFLEAMAGRYGEVLESDCLDFPDGQSMIGVLFRPDAIPTDGTSVAGSLRADMLLAGDTPDPDTPHPF